MPRKPVEQPVRYGLCPNGYFVIVPIVLALVSMTLTFFGTLTCEFFTIHEYGTPLRGVGLWHIEKIAYIEGELGYDEWRCEILDKDMVDDNLTAARAMSFLAVMFGLISCFTMLTFCCCGIKESRLRLIYKALCIVFLFVGFCIAMTGIALNSSLCQEAQYCDWSWGASLCIMSAIIWNVSGFTFCCCTPIKQKERKSKIGKKSGNDVSTHGVDHEAPQDGAAAPTNDEETPVLDVEQGHHASESDTESEDEDDGNAYETESTVDIMNTHEDTYEDDDDSVSDEESSYEHRNKRFRSSIDMHMASPSADDFEDEVDDEDSTNSQPEIESSSESDGESDRFDEEEEEQDDISETGQPEDEMVERSATAIENVPQRATLESTTQPAKTDLIHDESVTENEASPEKKKRGLFGLFGRKKSIEEPPLAPPNEKAEADKPKGTVKKVAIVEPAGLDPDEQRTAKSDTGKSAATEKAPVTSASSTTVTSKKTKTPTSSTKRKSTVPRDPPAEGEEDSLSDNESSVIEHNVSSHHDDDQSSLQSGYSA